jgi:hypothetical protein
MTDFIVKLAQQNNNESNEFQANSGFIIGMTHRVKVQNY